MFLKMVKYLPSKENDTIMIEGDVFRWGWRTVWPDGEYWLPYPIAEYSNKDILVVEVYRNRELAKTLVVFEASCYIMNDEGKTIDSFVSYDRATA